MRLLVLGVIVLVALVGLVSSLMYISNLEKKVEKITSYREKFVEMLNQLNDSGNLNQELYYELLEESKPIQYELAEDGIAAVFLDPLRGVQYRNYQMLVNFFSDVRLSTQMPSLYLENLNIFAGYCDEAMIRHVGGLRELVKNETSHIKNPIYCFSQGVRFIIKLPVDILFWCGIISDVTRYRIHNFGISVLVQKVFVFLSFLSCVISIVLGWEEFLQFVLAILNIK